jgi:internalin A
MAEGGREGSDEDAADFVDYLARRSGLLLPRGQDQFAFLHLSFQEYFAAAFLQNQIASPAWLTGNGRVAQGATKDDLQGYAGETVWRETLVFLVELVAASEQPMWLEPILAALSGENFEGLSAEFDDPAGQNQAVLIARLAIDPHAGFSTSSREQAIEVCCRREVQLMTEWFGRQEWWRHSNEVLRVLFGAEPHDRQTVLPAIAKHAQQQQAPFLNLGGTGVVDVSGLSGLTSLKWLNLQGTGVSEEQVEAFHQARPQAGLSACTVYR